MFGLLLGNWKLIALVAGAAGLFLAGWTVNGWRHDAALKRAETAYADDLREARGKVLDEWNAQRAVDDASRVSLTEDLAQLETVNTRLQMELNDAELVKPITVVEERWRERIITEESETCGPPVLANPFTAEFARLYNESSHRNSGGLPGPDPEG